MLDNKSKVRCFQYSINLGTPILFFYNLVHDIGSNIIEDFKLKNLFNEDFKNAKELRINEETTLKDVAFQTSSFYNKEVINKINLSQLDIFFIYKTEKIFFSYGNEKKRKQELKNGLSKLIKNQRILEELIFNIKEEKIRKSLENLLTLKFEDLFQNIVELTSKDFLHAPFLPYSFLKEDQVKKDYIEQEDVWTDTKKFNKVFGLHLTNEKEEPEVSALTLTFKDSQKIFAVKFNHIVFPLSEIKDLDLIKESSLPDYYWLLFKEVYKEDQHRQKEFESPLLKRFKEKMKDPILNKLLSFLENNLCTDDSGNEFLDVYQDFFEEVSHINNLKNIEEYDFYVSNEKGTTALGIYTTKKHGSSFNLIHWLKRHGEISEYHHYRNIDKPGKKDIKNVQVLKPELAFYFITNYFEDFLEQAIKENTVEYIKNFKLYANSSPLGEFDFLIKSKSTFYFIEAKTKLSNRYIEDYIEKCNLLLSNLNQINNEINIKFYLISAYSDETCEKKRYFINTSNGTRTDYNIKRQGLKTLPYHFDVPIPQHRSARLTCIAEPEFDKMKLIIQNICQK